MRKIVISAKISNDNKMANQIFEQIKNEVSKAIKSCITMTISIYNLYKIRKEFYYEF